MKNTTMKFMLICRIMNTSINYRRILAVNYVKQTVLYHRIFIFALLNICLEFSTMVFA